MSKLESIKKTSKTIGKIGKFCQIVLEILTGAVFLSTIIIFICRDLINQMIIESGMNYDTHNMGSIVQALAREGKVAEAFAVFGLSISLYGLLMTLIIHFVVRIFKRFCNHYSPFLPEVVKDFKIISVLVTLLALRSSLAIAVILGFVLYGMIQIYEYGCELQNQADETL